MKELLPLLLRVAGRKVLVIALLAIARTALSNRLARLQGYLFRAAFLRRVPLFMRNLAGAQQRCVIAYAVYTLLLPVEASLVDCFGARVMGIRIACSTSITHPPLCRLVENLVLCGVAAGLEATSRSWVSYMELQWRRLLTEKLHGTYFANMVRWQGRQGGMHNALVGW